MNYIITALSQPSTYAGFAGLALALGVSQPLYAAGSAAAAAVFAFVAVFLNEKKAK